MGLFNRKAKTANADTATVTNNTVLAEKPNDGAAAPATTRSSGAPSNEGILPRYNHNGHLVTKGIHPDGESGRSGVHPLEFVKIVCRSSCTVSSWVNLLWPFVPAAIA